MVQQKILVIEDDRKIRRLMAYNLELAGYQTVIAENGQTGLDLAESTRPDLIVLDIMMPDIDGYQVAKKLRADTWTAEIPIIFLTARAGMADKLYGFKLGADDYMTKPFNVDELLARIKVSLSRRS